MLKINKQPWNDEQGNVYYYEDNQMYFTFNHVYSRQYGLFMVNKGDEVVLSQSTGASTTYTTPKYQGHTYVLGTTLGQRTFKLKVAAEGLTLDQYQEMLLWLQEGTIGPLSFDYRNGWSWNVVLETIGDSPLSLNSDGYLIVQFDLTFKTYGNPLAYTTNLALANSTLGAGTDAYHIEASDNEFGIPIVTYSGGTFRIASVSNQYATYRITGTPSADSNTTNNVSITSNGTRVVTYSGINPALRNFRYDSANNMISTDDGYIETNHMATTAAVLSEPQELPCTKPQLVPNTTYNISHSGATYTINFTNVPTLGSNEYIAIVARHINLHAQYNKATNTGTTQYGYPYDYWSMIVYGPGLSSQNITTLMEHAGNANNVQVYRGKYYTVQVSASNMDYLMQVTQYNNM